MSNKSDEQFPIFKRIKTTLLQIFAIIQADLRKLRHDPCELLTRMFQPAIWLLIFGQAMAKAQTISTGETSYLNYIAPGIVAQSVLFVGIFYGIALIWERDMGILHKILVTPTPRSALILGRALSAGIRCIPQVIIIYLLSYLLGIDVRLDVPSLAGVFIFVLLGGAIFSTLSLIVASLVKKRERFMGIGQVLTMPLFFASNALYPISLMPKWLQTLSHINPMTYQVDALRSLMIKGETSSFGLNLDFCIGLFVFFLLLALAKPLYPKIIY